jgi:hypothetical protein
MSASEKAGAFFTVQFFNPNGIATQSLGLRACELTWGKPTNNPINSTGGLSGKKLSISAMFGMETGALSKSKFNK